MQTKSIEVLKNENVRICKEIIVDDMKEMKERMNENDTFEIWKEGIKIWKEEYEKKNNGRNSHGKSAAGMKEGDNDKGRCRAFFEGKGLENVLVIVVLLLLLLFTLTLFAGEMFDYSASAAIYAVP